jgi:hypothetical protein
MALAAQRHAVVRNGTWDERARQLAAVIHSLLQGQPYSQPAAERREAQCAPCSKT